MLDEKQKMTPEQEKIIREKARFTRRQYPLNQNVVCGHQIFDLYALLPDVKVERYLRDCLTPPAWCWIWYDEDDEREERGEWRFHKEWERRHWYSPAMIELDLLTNLSEEEKEKMKSEELESALDSLLAEVSEATDYEGNKTPEELKTMHDYFEKIRADGPPKEIPKREEEFEEGL